MKLITKYMVLQYLLLVCFEIPIAMADDMVDSSGFNTKVSNSESAIMQAHKYTGFDELDGYSKTGVTAQRVIPDAKKSPYVARIIGKSEVWEIVYRNVKTGRGGHFVNRDFSILINDEGRLLSIYSVSDDAGSSDTLRQMAPEMFTGRFGFEANKIYDSIPLADFSKVMERCFKNPARAKVIRAFLYCYSPGGDIPCKYRWVVILHGATPMLMTHRGQGIPVNQRNSFIYRCDPETGWPLNGSNIPAYLVE